MGRFQLNVHHVISFYCVAKEQSFSKAAELLGVTQSAVNQHVRGLELQFGVTLLNLIKKRIHLTKAGEQLMGYAEELFNQTVLTENFLKSYHYNNVSLGIASPLTNYLTPLIDHFKEIYPSIMITIREGPSQSMVEEVLNYRLDICMVGKLAPYDEKLRSFRIDREEQLVFVAGPEYPLPGNSPVKWEQLISHPFIMKAEGSASRAMLHYEFKKRRLKPIIGSEVCNIELAKELTKQNKGIAFMFEPNVHQEVARGELKIIHVESGEIRMGAIDVLVRREKRLSPSVESFLSMIKKHFNNKLHELDPEQKPEAWMG